MGKPLWCWREFLDTIYALQTVQDMCPKEEDEYYECHLD